MKQYKVKNKKSLFTWHIIDCIIDPSLEHVTNSCVLILIFSCLRLQVIGFISQIPSFPLPNFLVLFETKSKIFDYFIQMWNFPFFILYLLFKELNLLIIVLISSS